MRRFLSKTHVVLFLAFACLTSVMLPIMYYAVSLSTEKSLLTYKKQYDEDQAYKLAYAVQTHFHSNMPRDEQRKILEQFAVVYSTGVRFYSPDRSEVLFESAAGQHAAVQPYDIDVPLFVDGNLIGIIQAQYDLGRQGSYYPGHQMESSMRITVLFVGMWIVSVIVSFFLAGKLSRPVVAAARSAALVANGYRETAMPVIGTHELKQIANAIHALVADFDRQEEWRKQMMQDLAHELRTPLTSLLSRIEAIMDGVYPMTETNLNKIYNAIDRLIRLVVDLEKLSEAEGARFTLNVQRVDMTHLVKDVYEEFLLMAGEKGIRVVFRNPHVPCYAEVDPDRMIQVLLNLLFNAIKYTPEGGEIEIGLHAESNKIEFFCRDNGIGISEHDLSLIFNRFYRVDKSRARESGGIGVGLSIAKALVEAHGGTIGVESHLGEGATFYFTISEAGGN